MRDSEHPQRCSVNRYAVLHFVIESAKDVFSTYLLDDLFCRHLNRAQVWVERIVASNEITVGVARKVSG